MTLRTLLHKRNCRQYNPIEADDVQPDERQHRYEDVIDADFGRRHRLQVERRPALTYGVVVFSILVQGLSIGYVTRKSIPRR